MVSREKQGVDMAVYRVEKGEWSRVADDLFDVIDWQDGEDLEAALRRYSFTWWNDVTGVYRVFGCVRVPVSGPLAGVRHVFSIEVEGDFAQDILVADWFPDYLHVIERLEVLVRKRRLLLAEMDQQQETGSPSEIW